MSYEEVFIIFNHVDHPVVFTISLLSIVVLLAAFKTLLPKKERLIESTQTLFFTAIAGNYLDSYLYPGSPKWLLGLNLADIYMICSVASMLFLANHLFKLKQGKVN